MTIPSEYSYIRYLAAKKSVDDRALNKDVWRALTENLPPGTALKPVRILEVGAGIGTMLARALEWDLFKYADYTALDAEPECIDAMPGYLSQWAEETGGNIIRGKQGLLEIEHKGQHALLQTYTGDFLEFIQNEVHFRSWHLVIAHAFLDLIDIPAALTGLLQVLQPGGWFYLTINFDGATLFEPQIDPILDRQIERLYHRTMDERIIKGRSSGDSQTGRHLFACLKQAGGEILSAGASDWVVFPGLRGYPCDEGYFLHFILNTIKKALDKNPELDPDLLGSWIDARHAQVEEGKLIYIAHQLDFFGRIPKPVAHTA